MIFDAKASKNSPSGSRTPRCPVTGDDVTDTPRKIYHGANWPGGVTEENKINAYQRFIQADSLSHGFFETR